MKKFYKKILIILNFALALSCTESVKDKSIIVIDIKNSINKKVPTDFKLNDIADCMSLIPVETNDSTLFGDIIIVGVTDEDIVIHGGNIGVYKKAVYFINKNSGKVSSIIDRYGQGPADYLRIGNVFLNNRSNTLYISDLSKTNEYTFDDKFIRSIKNDSIAMFRVLTDGDFAVSYSPLVNTEFALGIYDSLWVLKRKGIYRVKEERKFDMIYLDNIFKFNSDFFYRLAHGDTLYRIPSEFEEPYLVHAKGKYSIPLDIKASRENSEKYVHRYIQHDYGLLLSKYYFLTYYYDEKFYSEIWDIEKNTLIYKSEFSRDGGTNGVPVVIDNNTIYVWPAYVSDDSLYCIINNEDAIMLIPSLTEDTNPIILEIKIN